MKSAGTSAHEYLLVLDTEFLIQHNKYSGVIICFELNKVEIQATKTRYFFSMKHCEGDVVVYLSTGFVLY